MISSICVLRLLAVENYRVTVKSAYNVRVWMSARIRELTPLMMRARRGVSMIDGSSFADANNNSSEVIESLFGNRDNEKKHLRKFFIQNRNGS